MLNIASAEELQKMAVNAVFPLVIGCFISNTIVLQLFIHALSFIKPEESFT